MKKNNQDAQEHLFPELTPKGVMKPTKKSSKKKNDASKREILVLKKIIKTQNAEIEALKKEKNELQSKAEAFDDLVKSRNLFPIGTIAKAFGHTAEWLNKYLADKGIQFKRKGDIWKLYAKYDKCGYTGIGWFPYAKDSQGRDLVRAHTYWTTKGMAFIRQLLIEDGYWTD